MASMQPFTSVEGSWSADPMGAVCNSSVRSERARTSAMLTSRRYAPKFSAMRPSVLVSKNLTAKRAAFGARPSTK